MGREGASPRVSGMSFKAVAHVVLILGAEMWVTKSRIGQALGGLQHRFTQHITGRQPWRLLDGRWDYPPQDTAMQEAGSIYMEEYVLRRQNTVVQYIAMLPIMDLC